MNLEKSATAKKPKRKASLHSIKIWNRHFESCIDVLTGLAAVNVPQLFREKDQTLACGNWLVKICERRNAVVVTCREEPLSGKLICNKTLPLKSGMLFLMLDYANHAEVFFKEDDYEQLLRQRGIYEIKRRTDLNAAYVGDWQNTWVTGSGKSSTPEQDLFWAMSDDVNAVCQIEFPGTPKETPTPVRTPLDDPLLLYTGKISYEPHDASWVVTCAAHRHAESISTLATLYLLPGRDLGDVIDALDSYLAAMNYQSFSDCFKMVTYLDYGQGV